MSGGLNVIALISGGKDGFFSLLHCVENGHKVIALANLYPSDQSHTESLSTDRLTAVNARNENFSSHEELSSDFQNVRPESSDLNSFMYQTVGHSLIPLYSIALQLPLYRQQITGVSIQQSQYYDTSVSAGHLDTQSPLDETEDLVPLLRRVISAHPEANAISTGAILSTYQRTRIESIAVRLGLTPLSFLWQYPVLPPPTDISKSTPPTNARRPDSLTGLLEDIAASGLDARIIKIASAGITESLLFASVADSRTHARLIKGLSPFFEDDDEIGLRSAVLGEGGEYETIALDGPKEVWKGGRIEIDETSNDSYTEGGVSYARFGMAKVVPHDEGSIPQSIASTSLNKPACLVPVPKLLDHQFESVRKVLHDIVVVSRSKSLNTTLSDVNNKQQEDGKDATHNFTITANTITINNLTSSSTAQHLEENFGMNVIASTPDSTSAADEMQIILSYLPTVLAILSRQLKIPSLDTTNISSATILLADMSDFASVNPIYSQIYPKGLPNPPARVTIAAPLPPGVHISLSLVLDLCSKDQRRGLHVQGRSYWAPANIGPYSQAIATPLQDRTQQQGVLVGSDDVSSNEHPFSKLEMVYIAGQIPLVPSSMEVYDGPFLDTAILSLQHLWRVGQERGVDIWPWSVAYLSQTPNSSAATQAYIAAAVWRQAHISSTWAQPEFEDDEEGETEDADDNEIDVWDIQRNRSQYHGFRQSKITVGKHLHLLPNHNIFHSGAQTERPKQKHIPPFIAAEVTALPRNVSVEWWSTGLAGFTKSASTPKQAYGPHWQTQHFAWGSLSSLHITGPHHETIFISHLISAGPSTRPDEIPTTLSDLTRLLDRRPAKIVQGMTLATVSALNSALWTHFTPLSTQTATIPCHNLWGHAATSTTKSTAAADHDAPSELSLVFLLRVEIGD